MTRTIICFLVFYSISSIAYAQSGGSSIDSSVIFEQQVKSEIPSQEVYVIEGQGQSKAEYPDGLDPSDDQIDSDGEELGPVCLAALTAAVDSCLAKSSPPLKLCHVDGPVLPHMDNKLPYSTDVYNESTMTSESETHTLVIECTALITCVCDEYSHIFLFLGNRSDSTQWR